MTHGKWRIESEEGGRVPQSMLNLQPVDPVAYRMKDVWGFDSEELPVEPFDIEIRITAPTVREGLQVFETAVREYLEEHFDACLRDQFLEQLVWSDDYAEPRVCEIVMGDC